ncbi:phospholipase/Carboxylesterase [Trichoderma gamsii]|uniref:Phospholipase/Carboxylesterase n=1 Tax=Trichoderma gamsii TaxID=398673 RepID=A0A2P4ZD73_9HYPO|nr:phospholipase/Carboxylesterase [Trichoderma gamsii]PON22229.1 phospholipase/Carboxylesterase [Trichoderma gamsii]
MSSPLVVGPATGHSHTHTIIVLHGRDSEAQEFMAEFFECEATGPETDRTLPALFPTVRWVFPQAKPLHSERFNIEMSQWFDMWSVEDQQERAELQIPGLRASVDRVAELIQEEELLVPRKRIFLSGISQGFATVLATFFADGRGGFAGLCGFSSWFPLAAQAVPEVYAFGGDSSQQLAAMQRFYLGRDESSPVQMTSTPILLGHCRDDEVIDIQSGTRLRDFLYRFDMEVDWQEYLDGGHWFNEPQGVDDFVRFLRQHM